MSAPPAQATTVAADNFDRADSTTLGTTSTGGYTWTEQSGDWSISGNQLAGSTNTGSAHVDPGHANGWWQIKRVGSGGSLNDGGLIFRYSDSSNLWRAYIGSPATTLKVVKFVAGTPTTVASYTVATATDVTRTIRVTANGSTIWVSYDGAVVGSIVDGHNSTATRAGAFACYVGARCDDFQTDNDGTDPTAPTTTTAAPTTTTTAPATTTTAQNACQWERGGMTESPPQFCDDAPEPGDWHAVAIAIGLMAGIALGGVVFRRIGRIRRG